MVPSAQFTVQEPFFGIHIAADTAEEYPPLVFLTSLLVVSIVEYVTAWILETIFHAKWWDYSDKRFKHKRPGLSADATWNLACWDWP